MSLPLGTVAPAVCEKSIQFVKKLAGTTLMVNTTSSMHPNPYVHLRPQLPWPPPQSGDAFEASRTIPFKIWDLQVLQTIANAVKNGDETVMRAVTRGCINDMHAEQITPEYAADLLLQLSPSDYTNSRWCNIGDRQTKCRPELLWLPCDAYVVRINQADEHGNLQTKKYYIKLCLNSAGKMLLLVSLHESNYG